MQAYHSTCKVKSQLVCRLTFMMAYKPLRIVFKTA